MLAHEATAARMTIKNLILMIYWEAKKKGEGG